MADYNERYGQHRNNSGQSTDQNKQADDFSADSSADSSSSTSPGGESYDSCGCGSGHPQGRKAFHPWEPETWECEETDACETSSTSSSSSASSRDASPSELDDFDRQAADNAAPAPTGPRTDANSPESRELYDDLIRSQRPEGSETLDASDAGTPVASESGSSTPMQWTLVDLAGKSCEVPGCDPATCDSEDCEDERRGSEYSGTERQDRQPVVSYRYGMDSQPSTGDSDSEVLASEPGPAPEPMFNAFAQGQAEAQGKAKRGKRVSKKAAAAMAGLGLTPEQPATEAAKPKKASGKKPAAKKATAKKPAVKKATAKKGGKKTTAKKGAKKPTAKKPTTPRGKKAAGGASATPLVTDPTLPTEKAA